MSKPLRPPRGMYFQEFEVGQRMSTASRTITEADVVNFAGLSGDFNLIHTDAHYAEGTHFGQRVAHGLLVLSIASGLAMRTGVMEGTVLAWRDIKDWKFTKAVHIGDTVHVEMEVLSTKAYPRLGTGLVELGLRVHNQQHETVMEGTWGILALFQPQD